MTKLEAYVRDPNRAEQVRESVMAKLKKHGKGIILMHDFQHATADAIPQILDDLKAGGYTCRCARATSSSRCMNTTRS